MKTLIVKLGALGDIVIATSLIKRVQQSYPDDELFLLTTPAFSGLFENWSGLQVIAFERKGFKPMWQALSWIRSQQFDRVFDFQSNDRSAVLMALSGIPVRIGNLPRFPYTCHPSTWYQSECHIFERMNEVLASAGLAAADPSPFLPSSDDDKRYVQTWLLEKGLKPGKFVVMHAGASPRWPSKCWPYYQELAQALELQDVVTVWLGAKDEALLNAGLSDKVGIDASSAFSIIQLAELGRHARFAVTNDSGPMHILSASDIPVFSFFGPTRWIKNHALGQGDRVLRHEVACSPCSLGHCPPDKEHACMRSIRVDEVLRRIGQEGLLSDK